MNTLIQRELFNDVTMITTRAHRLTRINQGYKQFNKNNISFSKSYDLLQNFILLHRFLQSTVIEKKNLFYYRIYQDIDKYF